MLDRKDPTVPVSRKAQKEVVSLTERAAQVGDNGENTQTQGRSVRGRSGRGLLMEELIKEMMAVELRMK